VAAAGVAAVLVGQSSSMRRGRRRSRVGLRVMIWKRTAQQMQQKMTRGWEMGMGRRKGGRRRRRRWLKMRGMKRRTSSSS
jgi:hypothetical protein